MEKLLEPTLMRRETGKVPLLTVNAFTDSQLHYVIMSAFKHFAK